MVGDPNQAVFQFRKSDSKFLLEFEALDFHLTINFRSVPQIVDLGEDIVDMWLTKPHTRRRRATSSRAPVENAVTVITGRSVQPA